MSNICMFMGTSSWLISWMRFDAHHEPEQDRVKRICTIDNHRRAEWFEQTVAGKERYHLILYMRFTQGRIKHQETRDDRAAAEIIHPHGKSRNFDFF